MILKLINFISHVMSIFLSIFLFLLDILVVLLHHLTFLIIFLKLHLDFIIWCRLSSKWLQSPSPIMMSQQNRLTLCCSQKPNPESVPQQSTSTYCYPEHVHNPPARPKDYCLLSNLLPFHKPHSKPLLI